VADGVRVLRSLAGRWHPRCGARHAAGPGEGGGRARWRAVGGDRFSVGAGRGHRGPVQPGWDNGKKVNGRKRHIAVDVLGLLLAVVVTSASVQDRDRARPLLWRLRATHRGVRLAWADAGYAGKLAAWAATTLRLSIEVVRKRDPHAFEVLPRRWVVERTFAWISKNRRRVRDYERLPDNHEAMIKWAMIALMTRCLARQATPAQPTRTALASAA
jgi:transposase